MHKIEEILSGADEEMLRMIIATASHQLKKLGEMGQGFISGEQNSPGDSSACLDGGGLKKFCASFENWSCAPGLPSSYSRSRARIWLIFLLIRYGGLRLGEVLGLDDRTDFDFKSSHVVVGGAHARRLPIPVDVMEKIRRLLESPMLFALRGSIFKLDQGYVRRKFYARGAACNLPAPSVSPRMLRYARGAELLASGVPARAVQIFLGETGQPGADNYPTLSSESAQRIVQEHLAAESRFKTSARNVFVGRVSKLASSGVLAVVELHTLSGLKVTATVTEASSQNLRLREGSIVIASVKAPWVILAPEGEKSAVCNRFAGTVETLRHDSIVAEVVVALDGAGKICALVERELPGELNLREGARVAVLFKSSSVILGLS